MLTKPIGVAYFLLIALPSFIQCGCPHIFSRADWGARHVSRQPSLSRNPPPYVVVHHSAGPECTTEAACKATVKGFQNYHIDSNHWGDIGYNFVVGGDGNIYEARGWGVKGAHVPKYNAKSIGICLVGNFQNATPSNKQLEALKNLMACGVDLGKISGDYHLIGHRQGKATTCPGDKLFDIIKGWPHFDQHPN